MKAELAAVRVECDSLRRQLAVARAILNFPHHDFDGCNLPQVAVLCELIESGATELRLHLYRSTIVSLYGCFEQFIDRTVQSAVTRLAALATNYSDLPETIRDQHRRLTLTVLSQPSNPRFQGLVSDEELIGRLHNCLQGIPRFRLNAIVFTHRTANYRHDIVKEIFGRAGISLDHLLASPGLREIMRRHFPEEEKLYFVVNDLAQRRNDVSHGMGGTLLSMPLMLDYIDVIEAYAVALTSVVIESVVDYAIQHQGIDLGVPDRVFDNCVAGYYAVREDLSVGDLIAYRRGDGRSALAPVQTLETNNQPRQRVCRGESAGLRTALRCTERTELFLLPAALSDLEGTDLETFPPSG